MIDDMALLKQAMEQMDAEDPVVAQAAKDRAAQTLSDARLNFSKMAELIEQRRLLLRPRIVASIKRMDQPGMLGDSAFRDAGSALRKKVRALSDCRSNRAYRQIRAPIRGDGAKQRAAVPDGERARYAPLAESAGFYRATLFCSRLRHPIRFRSAARLLAIPAVLSTPCVASSPLARRGFGISRWRGPQSVTQRGQGDVVGGFFRQ